MRHALRGHIGHALAPAHRAGDLLDQKLADPVGIGHWGSEHVRDHRHDRLVHHHLGQRLGHRVGGRLHQAAMERRGDREQHGALGALGLGDLDRALDRRLVAGHHHLPAAIVVGGLADLALRGFVRHRDGGLVIEAEQCGHRAGADRGRLLHRQAANPQEPRGVGNRQAARGGQRRIFAERMARDERHVARQIDPGLALQHPQGGERHRHQGRLGVLGHLQGIGRAVPDHGAQLLAQRLVDLVEHRTRRRKRLGERLAHADAL